MRKKPANGNPADNTIVVLSGEVDGADLSIVLRHDDALKLRDPAPPVGEEEDTDALLAALRVAQDECIVALAQGEKVVSVITGDGENYLDYMQPYDDHEGRGDYAFEVATDISSARSLVASIEAVRGDDEFFRHSRSVAFPGHERKSKELTLKGGRRVTTWIADVSLVTFGPAYPDERSLFIDAFERDLFTQAATAFFALDRFAEGGMATLRGIASTVVGDSGEEEAERLALETLGPVGQLKRSSPVFTTPPKQGEENAPDAWRDAFANFIGKTGKAGAERAAEVRKAGSWRLWCDPSEAQPFGFVEVAMRAVWLDIVQPQFSRENEARPFAPGIVRARGDRYAKQPKFIAPISWALGAPGMREVNVDGDRYAPEPVVVAARLVPRTFPLFARIPGHENKPHQTVLALEHDEPIALPVAVTGATAYAISPIAAKLALVMLAAPEVRTGQLQRVTLGELARWTHPSTKRLRPREISAVARGLDELRLLFVYLPDGRKVQTFDTTSATNPDDAPPGLTVRWGLTRTFIAALADGIGDRRSADEAAFPSYRGEFLINLDGAMRLPTNRPSLLRHYIRAAAHWNAAFKPGSSGTFDPGMMRQYTAEDWATITNSVPPGVVEYLKAQGLRAKGTSTGRAAWSKERKAMLDDLAELEALGLVEVSKGGSGRNERFKILPTGAYLEAKAQARKAGTRPDDT